MPRYARQRALREIGPAGQARLEAHVVGSDEGDPRASEIARLYLARAGLPMDGAGAPLVVASREAVSQLAGAPHLEEAAAFLAGAFAAVERIKLALDVGRPGSLEGLTLDGGRGPEGR